MLKIGDEFMEVIKTSLMPIKQNNNGWEETIKIDGKRIFRRRYEEGSSTLAANTGKNIYTIPMPNGLSTNYVRKMYTHTNIRELIFNWHTANIIQIHNPLHSTVSISSIMVDLEIEEI